MQKLVSEKYKIAIDNLCTFLPQDRVGSFSGFDSKMLLKETEKSISASQHLYQVHEQLMELEKEILESDNNLQTIQDKADTLQNEVNRLEREKELMEERAKYMEQLQLLKQKLAWVRFEAKRLTAVELKDQRKEMKRRLATSREQLVPVEQEIEHIQEDLSRNTERKNALARVINSTLKQSDGGLKKAEKYSDEIEDLKLTLTEMDSTYRRAKNKVIDFQGRVEQYQQLLDTIAPEKDLVEVYRQAHQEQREIREKMRLVKIELQRYQQ